MNRLMKMAAAAACVFILAVPLQAALGLLFEGKLVAADGRPVAGAEVELLAASGEMRSHVYSSMDGRYRFPIVMDAGASPYRIRITHLRYQPVEVKDAVSGAAMRAPGREEITPAMSPAMLAATRVVRRDFRLALSRGTPQHPTLGPIDPNFAEYCYQQALLLLNQDRKQAVELLKVYAQTGFNPRQVARSLQLIALHDTR